VYLALYSAKREICQTASSCMKHVNMFVSLSSSSTLIEPQQYQGPTL